MQAQEQHLAVTRTARYYQLGELSAATRRVWFVVHGYGQLAAYFIRHFAVLTATDPTLVVIAPEGLSRFYLQGTGGRVGATWMTKDDRLTEIADYVAYLNQLAELLLPQAAAEVDITVLGFSQGAATVGRWLAQATFRPAHLVLWAGAFPPDMELPAATQLLRQLPITLVCGTEDEFITEASLGQQQQFLEQLGASPRLIRFPGRHALHAPTLVQLANGLT
ncbi:alpha/beta hydrolase [Hymenobacter metallilatus]|uniref:Phospholipase n=1 Tax=Hymenobacter metallilatus TaxID=2493666 RepID=A0A428JMK6_9BACT|nr:phospholipase [Hymenobacter metallilatus]RSK34517.1 phospholipase [Hymenobacter metallilatus]